VFIPALTVAYTEDAGYTIVTAVRDQTVVAIVSGTDSYLKEIEPPPTF
jgi:hypothetical protein